MRSRDRQCSVPSSQYTCNNTVLPRVMYLTSDNRVSMSPCVLRSAPWTNHIHPQQHSVQYHVPRERVSAHVLHCTQACHSPLQEKRYRSLAPIRAKAHKRCVVVLVREQVRHIVRAVRTAELSMQIYRITNTMAIPASTTINQLDQ